ncbi:MAG: DUF1918 domain-containing protein [Actinomycetota bacterium]
MEPKRGDRVSLDAKKVGQPRRAGIVRSVAQGISGVRYQVEWDDGSHSVIAPGAGILLIEGKIASSSSKKPMSSSNKKPKASSKSQTKKPRPATKAKKKKAR